MKDSLGWLVAVLSLDGKRRIDVRSFQNRIKTSVAGIGWGGVDRAQRYQF